MAHFKLGSELINMTLVWDKELKIHTDNDFDSADPSSIQDACQVNSVKWLCFP